MKRTPRLRSAALAILCMLGFGLARAQITTVTASHLKLSGYPISTGTVVFVPVNTLGTPIAFSDGSGAQDGPTGFPCQVTAGAIVGAITETGSVSGVCQVPDATLTTPANILYSIQVCDNSTGQRTSGQCYTLQQVIGVSGTTWALDHYGPPATTTNVAVFQATQGTTLPSPCVGPSIFILLTGGGAYSGSYTCVAGVEVQLGSGGPGPAGPAGPTGAAGTAGAAATIAVGSVTALAAGASPTVTNAGSSSAATFNFGIPAGATGPAGPSGTVGTLGQGAYAGGTTYPLNAIVTSGGLSYISIQAANVGNTPSGSPTYWFQIAGAGGSSAFNAITSGTNGAAAMVIGTGASLSASGTGTIAATSVPSTGVTGILAPANGGSGSSVVPTPGQIDVGNAGGTAFAPVTLSGSCTMTYAGVITCSGSGTMTTFTAPSGSWPSWLVPTVTNPTTTPQLAVAASAIPNTALANSSITVNGTAIALGASGSITATPAAEVKFYPAAICDGGTAFASGVTRYDNQQPQAGCFNPAGSAQAYLAFNPAASLAQYAEATISYPPYWTGDSIIIDWASGAYSGNVAATTGSVTWYVQYFCPAANAVPATGTFSTAVPVASTVSSTSGGEIFTSSIVLAANGANGCPATGNTTPGKITYRIYRSLTDGMTTNAWLIGLQITTGRSQ
jgi:hypothetical protein